MKALLLIVCMASSAGCVSVTVPAGGNAANAEREARAAAVPADAERSARVRLELAGLYFGRGQPDTALEEVKRAIAAKSDMPEAYSLRGLIQAALGDVPGAEESFRRSLQLAPRDGDTMHNYGWFLCQQRRYADADAQFSGAIAQPQYREVMRTLLAQGVCQARAGQWVDAERTLSRSFELDPTNPVTAYNLSDVLLQRGELERARFYIARVNAVHDLTTAQSLWLAARIERRLGNVDNLRSLGRQLRDRFPQSPETLQFDQGRFE